MKKNKKIGLSLNKKTVSNFHMNMLMGGSHSCTGTSGATNANCQPGTGSGNGFTQGNRCQQSEQLIGGCNEK